MIKLKDLLKEYQASLNTELGPVPPGHTGSAWGVTSPFKVTVATGKMVPSNMYYGASRVSKDPGREETARKDDALVHLNGGGDYLVSEKRKKAWKILYLGPERSLGGNVPNQAPRTKIPKSSVDYYGEPELFGLEYKNWKSWVVAQ